MSICSAHGQGSVRYMHLKTEYCYLKTCTKHLQFVQFFSSSSFFLFFFFSAFMCMLPLPFFFFFDFLGCECDICFVFLLFFFLFCLTRHDFFLGT